MTQIRRLAVSDSGRPLTMGAWLSTWLESIEPGHRTNTITKYETVIRLHLVPRIGGVRLSEFSTTHATRLFMDLSRTISGKYLLLVRAVLSRSMRDAVLAGRALVNPISSIAMPKSENTEKRVLTPKEYQAFINAAKQSKYPFAMLVLVQGGLRRGEALALKWSDVAFSREEITINETLVQTKYAYELNPPKTKQSRRTVRLPKMIFELLATIPEADRRGLITQDGVDQPVPFHKFRAEFKRVLRMAGIPHVTIHEMRHTHASLLLDQGVPIGDVSRRLGHSNISTTFGIYGHLVPGEANKSVQAIERLNANQPQEENAR